MRIGVAATAPFGADVLERLADRFDVAFLLTRPDRPRGRGRRVAPPPAKLVAERGRHPRAPARTADARAGAGRRRDGVAAYGLLIPASLLERTLWLNVHPSLLPRWRGAAPVERAIMAGDGETGVTIHETVEELDAGPIAAQRAFAIEPEDDAGAVFARAAELAPQLLAEVLPAALVHAPAGGRGQRMRRSSRPTDRELDLTSPRRGACESRARALAAHRRAGSPARASRDRVASARRWTARSSRSRCSRRAGGA